MFGHDREPLERRERIGRRTKPTNQRPVRRRRRDEDDEERLDTFYDDEAFDDEYDEPVMRRRRKYDDEYDDEDVDERRYRRRRARYEDDMDDTDDEDDDYEENPKGKKPRKRRRWLFWLLFKLALIFAVVIAGYGFYLDAQIRSKVDGKVWDLPAAVYGRMLNLEPGMPYSKKEVVALLEGTQYREVTKITRPGEFTISGNNIEVMRRPFDFPDAKEGQVKAKLYFDGSGLARIQNMETNRDFGFFRLDPRLITMMQSANGEQRLFVPRNGFPDLLVDTLIATEDRHFYEHDGVSLFSIARAVVANVMAGRAVQGGSTLTQQLVKNLFLTNERSLWRKINEAYMAVLLDYRYSKDRILELYLNEVFLGQSGADEIRGFPLASLYYFGRPVNELSLDQQAMLVGMVKGASLYNPWKNPEKTLERRNLVLSLLVEQKIIDNELFTLLSTRPLGVQPKGGVISPQPAFMQIVREELQRHLGSKASNLSGVKIFTTLDPVSQDAAEKAVSEGIPALQKAKKLNDLQGSMVVVDRFSGEIRAVVSGVETQFAGFNRVVQARRSIGSLAKPVTYLTALMHPDKYRLNTILPDQPVAIKILGSKTWEPKNYDHNYRGQVLLVDALANSLNVPTVNLGMALGLPEIIDTLQKLGVPKESIEPVPAMLLGAVNLTPMEVAQEYQSIASGGNRAKLSALRSVMAEDGTSLYQSFPQAEQSVPAQAAYLTLYAMQQVVTSGTSRALQNRFAKYHLAGKTGTTNDLRDSWFAGIDGKEVVITWVGRDDNSPTKLTGASGALTVYSRYLENQTPVPLLLLQPEDVHEMSIDVSGNFVCGSGSRVFPVWTSDPDTLCAAGQAASVAQDPANTATPTLPTQQTDPDTPPANQDEAPGWLKEMFGQ